MGSETSPRGFIARLSQKLRFRTGQKPSRKLSKYPYQPFQENGQLSPGLTNDTNELGEREYSIFSNATTLVDTRDHTEMFHGLAHYGSFDSLVEGLRHNSSTLANVELSDEQHQNILRISEEKQRMLGKLPNTVWSSISKYLDPAEKANLIVSCHIFMEKLGTQPFRELKLARNRHYLIRFLNHMDSQLPGHLLCYPCGQYHMRTNWGRETLKADFVRNPLYVCPSVRNTVLPRIRLTYGRELPYSFIQLAVRHGAHSKHFGIPPESLNRRWKDRTTGWSHQSRYLVHDNRLLMRIRSQVFASPNLTPTAERMLLYDRQEFIPFFSVCAHWRDGELMKVCKCALSHIPKPRESLRKTVQHPHEIRQWIQRPSFMAHLCDDCRPARRCPECPSEYLVEINLAEDKSDPVQRFKHAMVVTRWSDLGDGSSPTASPEYCAVTGTNADYSSFNNVGRRAVAGIFESKISGTIPGQRMISLNPKNEKLGEAGHGWY